MADVTSFELLEKPVKPALAVSSQAAHWLYLALCARAAHSME